MQAFQGHPTSGPAVSAPPSIRPRVRARRGQATDPHSIAERVYHYQSKLLENFLFSVSSESDLCFDTAA